MRILYGTTNPAKQESMRRITDPLDIELVGLHQLNKPIPMVEETGRYRNAICLVLDETTCFSSMDESLETEPFIIVSEPHEKRVKGFPLDSLSIDIPSGKYYYDVEEKSLDGCDMDQGFTNFFRETLKNQIF